MMKSTAWLFAAALSAAGAALAQTEPQSTVTEITDPARITDIERRAQELVSRGQSSSSTAAPTSEQAAGDKQQARAQKYKGKHKRAMKDKAASEPAGSTEGK
jgi:hypothetical protein